MAKIKMSSIGITNIIGKAGGTIYSKNKGGLYIKNFVPPSNPQTTKQQLVRGEFGVTASGWSSLLEAERSAWKAAAATFPYQDDFGDTKYYSGFGLYMKMNSELNTADLNFRETPGLNIMPAIIDDVSPAEYHIGTNTLTITVEFAGQAPEDGAVVIQATPQLPPGRASADTLMRKLNSTAYAANATTVSPDATAQYNVYNNMFGSLNAGDRFLLRVKAVSEGGRATAWFYKEVIATAGV